MCKEIPLAKPLEAKNPTPHWRITRSMARVGCLRYVPHKALGPQIVSDLDQGHGEGKPMVDAPSTSDKKIILHDFEE